jgi:hypothetical protein
VFAPGRLRPLQALTKSAAAHKPFEQMLNLLLESERALDGGPGATGARGRVEPRRSDSVARLAELAARNRMLGAFENKWLQLPTRIRKRRRRDHALPRPQSTRGHSACRALVLLHLRTPRPTYKGSASRSAGVPAGSFSSSFTTPPQRTDARVPTPCPCILRPLFLSPRPVRVSVQESVGARIRGPRTLAASTARAR